MFSLPPVHKIYLIKLQFMMCARPLGTWKVKSENWGGLEIRKVRGYMLNPVSLEIASYCCCSSSRATVA